MSRNARPRLDVYKLAQEQAEKRARTARAAAVLAGDPAEHRASRRRELERRIDLPVSAPLEGRLLAAIICDPAVLAICDGVETDDFAVFGHQWVFAALRIVQARGEWVMPAWPSTSDVGARAIALARCIDALGDELARLDKRDEKHTRDTVDDLYLAELLARHTWETYGPPGSPIAAWVEHDARQLRELADRRRAL